MARYTIIGASGFIGRRVVDTLQQLGHDVYVPSRNDTDLFSQSLGKVVYCAGLTADYITRPYDVVEAHVSLLARLFKNAEFERLVYLSSTRLYDGLATAIVKEDVTLQFNTASSRHIYDLSKALGENLCLTVATGKASVARLSCVYDSTAESPGFLSEWMRRAAQEKIFCLESGTGLVRDYIHLDDVVAALMAILDDQETGIYNVASGQNVTNMALAEVFNRHGWSVTLQQHTPIQTAVICDVSRLNALGIKPRGVLSVREQFLIGVACGTS